MVVVGVLMEWSHCRLGSLVGFLMICPSYCSDLSDGSVLMVVFDGFASAQKDRHQNHVCDWSLVDEPVGLEFRKVFAARQESRLDSSFCSPYRMAHARPRGEVVMYVPFQTFLNRP